MRITDPEPVFSIGSAARKLQISIPTLRLYEKEGLICPMRTSTHRRLYSLNDLRIVETAQLLIHEDGLNFAGIRRLMAFLPCWKIRGCDPNLYHTCKVPCINDNPCWSTGLALWRKCEEDCQNCSVYKMASQIRKISIQNLIAA